MTVSEALAIAIEHHRAGRLQAAEQAYRQILALEPTQPDAWHLLGVASAQAGNFQAAVDCIHHAVAIKPDYPEAHYNLGAAFQDLRRLDEAVACFRRTLELNPDHAEAHYGLGSALHHLGKLDEAIVAYRRVVELKPDHAEAHNNLGTALKSQGNRDEAIACFRRAMTLEPERAEIHYNLGCAFQDQRTLDEAIACFRRAIERKPDYAEAHNNLGNALKERGDLEEAVACYRRAEELRPDCAEVHYNMGYACHALGRLGEAVACYHRALQLQPDHAETHNNLGNVLKDQGRLDEAVACYRRALDLKPDHVEAYNNLGNAKKDQGDLDDAIACYRRALALNPECAEAHSNLVYALSFFSDYNAKAIDEELRLWNERFAEPLGRFIQPHCTDRDAARRLRIGYVSPDFRRHPVGRFLLPLLESHDHEAFEIVCYASVLLPDAVTERCRGHADVWRNVLGLPDEQVAEMIRQDGIDILVDLTMHMAHNRLLVFARKPAPVQVTYLAYCGTTGLRAMDYRLTDPYLDPPGRDEPFYSEKSIHLPETYWCYRPLEEAPTVSAAPVADGGHVTFGCLNNFCKVTAPTLAAWSRLLNAMPWSRLLLHAHAGSHRDRLRDYVDRQGISPDRLEFAGALPAADYFRLYGRIDVALDPFPYGGGTTTCDALWMGVPVVSLAGQTAMGRAGLSILSNVGLPDLVARDVDHYVRIAMDLARDRERRNMLRTSLRDRMRNSPLMDAPRFARNVEAAYRTMWHEREAAR